MRNPIIVDERFAVGREQPTAADLGRLAERGYSSVVNLRTAGEAGQTLSPGEEAEAARRAGLAYVHIPVSGEDLAPRLVDRFRDAVSQLPGRVLVHCASGKRSGALTMMHVGVERGMSGDAVLSEAQKLGIKCEPPAVKQLMRSYVEARR